MVEIRNLVHSYQQRAVLNIAKLDILPNSSWLILGNSGSGKTTLLHIIAGLLPYQQGSVKVLDTELNTLTSRQLDRFRAKNIGLVFQKSHHIGTLTVLENVLLAQYALGIKQNKTKCLALLEQLQISHLAKQYPAQLSQGEAQRLSIARAVINEPKLILADEPTASLDDTNAQIVANLLFTHAQAHQATLVVATHDQRLKPLFEHLWKIN
ncbi:MAG: ATP-binding cassette domain-containing protein [Microscillaceae bacterium]|nr:ATP-binding cassette domain-containing protein [Microscillaceae bacterium]MDW8461456.1 ATP-binding cassette domain-containing protein [Cytophagales bacterium]